jgi:hypothetical protein
MDEINQEQVDRVNRIIELVQEAWGGAVAWDITNNELVVMDEELPLFRAASHEDIRDSYEQWCDDENIVPF